jgi:two-component system response regulator YesN
MPLRDDTLSRRSLLYRDARAALAQMHHDPDLTIDDVAHAIATSRRQLQRVIAECGDVTFGRALQQTRMANARRLLVTTDLSVKEVCNHVGYRQPAQFAKTFRRYFGATPRAYRMRARGLPGSAAQPHPQALVSAAA